MHRLIWAFAGPLCVKYYNLMSWLIFTSQRIASHYKHADSQTNRNHHEVKQPFKCKKLQSKVPYEPHHEKTCIVPCEQQRRKSACASAQSDQHLCCSLPRWYNTYTSYIQNLKTLASFCNWAGRFESDLVANSWTQVFSLHDSIMVFQTTKTKENHTQLRHRKNSKHMILKKLKH